MSNSDRTDGISLFGSVKVERKYFGAWVKKETQIAQDASLLDDSISLVGIERQLEEGRLTREEFIEIIEAPEQTREELVSRHSFAPHHESLDMPAVLIIVIGIFVLFWI